MHRGLALLCLLFVTPAFAADRVSIAGFGFSILPPEDAVRIENKSTPKDTQSNDHFPWYRIGPLLIQFATAYDIHSKDLSEAFKKNQQQFNKPQSPFILQEAQTLRLRSGITAIRAKYSVKASQDSVIRFYLLNQADELVYAHILVPPGTDSRPAEKILIETLK